MIDIVGSWQLVSVVEWRGAVVVNANAMGENPSGFLNYLPNGRMTTMLANGGRALLSAGRYDSPSEERAAAFVSFFAYGGRYTRNGNQMTHHVEICSYQNDVGYEYTRLLEENGDDLVLRTPPLSPADDGWIMRLTWQRLNG